MLQLIERLANAGILVFTVDGKLKTKAAKGAITDEFASLIKANKKQLVSFLVNQSKFEFPVLIPRKQRAEGELVPLSFAQQRLWFLSQLNSGNSNYNIFRRIEITGRFRADIAERAFRKIIERHEPLRTNFVMTEQGPMQLIRDAFDFRIVEYDLTTMTEGAKQDRLSEIGIQEQLYSFELEHDLMLRVVFTKTGAETASLFFTIHHIAADGWSVGILINELSTFYQALLDNKPAFLPEPEIKYSDYASWQREPAQEQKMVSELRYWKEQLQSVPELHSLALDYERQSDRQGKGEIVHAAISRKLSRSLIELARQQKVTPFILLHAAFSLVLIRYSRDEEIVIGTPVANRVGNQLASNIGLFINTIALRTNTALSETFVDYLGHVRKTNMQAHANQMLPFEQVVEHLKVERNSQYSPLFQVMLSIDTTEKANLQFGGLGFSIHGGDHVEANYDLVLDAELSNGGGALTWTYDSTIFNRSRIESLNKHLCKLLGEIIRTPFAKLSELSMLSESERLQLLSQTFHVDETIAVSNELKLPNSKVLVLDCTKQPAPVGAIGELYIGEKQGLTQQQLNLGISVKFSDGHSLTMFPTGLLMKVCENGKLTYVGHDIVSEEDLQVEQDKGYETGSLVAKTKAEKVVSEIWAKVLSLPLETLDIRDNFFELGGHSLLLAKVLSKLKRKGYSASLKLLLENQSVQGLALAIDEIQNASGKLKRDILVQLNSAKASEILFFIHPGFGRVDCYLEIAKKLEKSISVVGIQAPHVANYNFDFNSLEEIAQLYSEAIVASYPGVHYRLAGWSVGGEIAYLVAAKLKQQNLPVESLLMLDSSPPMDFERLDNLTYLRNMAFALGIRLPSELQMKISDKELSEQITLVAQYLSEQSLPTLSGLEERYIAQAIKFEFKLSTCTVPTVPLEVDKGIDYIHALASHKDKSLIQRWRKVSQSKFNIYNWNSSHSSLLKDNVDEIAKIITNHL